MAFQFPDPNVTPEFTGANGITYSWDAADSKWRVKSFSDADDIFYQEDPPTLVENPNLAEGDIWVDSDDNKMYVWNGSVWSEVTACGSTDDDGDFVKKFGGDTMEGPLSISGDRSPDAEGIESTLTVYNVDSGRDGDLQLRRQGQTKVYVSTTGVALQGDVKINVDGSKLKSSDNAELLTFNKAGIFYEGAYSADKHIATKKDVEDGDDILANQIIELEEEIDALAPAVERGVWMFNLSGLVSDEGRISMYDADYSTTGDPTAFFKSAKAIWLNEKDNAGTVHGFGNVVQGNLIELFVEGKPDYGLYQVVAAPHEETNTVATWWVIEVQCLRALSDDSSAEPLDNIRVKIFEAPSGGDASAFVRKDGDEMSGDLTFEQARSDTDYNSFSKATAKITFENTHPLSGTKSTVHLFQPGATSSLIASNSFRSRSSIYSAGAYYGWSSTSGDIYEPNIKMDETYGYLKFGIANQLYWEDGGGRLLADGGLRLWWKADGIELRNNVRIFNNLLVSDQDSSRIYARSAKGSSSQTRGEVGQVLTSNANNGPAYWATPSASSGIIVPAPERDNYIEFEGTGNIVNSGTTITDDKVWNLDSTGRLTGKTPPNGLFFPYAWIKTNYPDLAGLVLADGVKRSGLYDNRQDPYRIWNPYGSSTPITVEAKTFERIPGISIWGSSQLYGSYFMRVYGIQIRV